MQTYTQLNLAYEMEKLTKDDLPKTVDDLQMSLFVLLCNGWCAYTPCSRYSEHGVTPGKQTGS